jgi:hypothetical protein
MSYTIEAPSFNWFKNYNTSGLFYLAPRTDGISGDGSPMNPFDASTVSKFDGLIERIQEEESYFLYPGVYYTHGCYWGVRGLKRGNKILLL